MQLTPDQFAALGLWIQAEIRAALSEKSCGPQVREHMDARDEARSIAWRLLGRPS